jgi:hypothetical protein
MYFKAKVLEASHPPVKTKAGRTLQKQEFLIADHTASIRITIWHVWDANIPIISVNDCNVSTDASTNVYQQIKTINTIMISSILPTEELICIITVSDLTTITGSVTAVRINVNKYCNNCNKLLPQT